ncbi:MAG: nucleoside-diphosphate-sugar epimerase [Patiriisocius sp.]|jgi:nucleoside-diphosphate-sugar epimerase
MEKRRAVVIGATGHIGSFLVPRLVAAGFHTIAVSRGTSQAYSQSQAWQQVDKVLLDRSELENDGEFGRRILALKPDIVIDLICFTADSGKQLFESLAGKIQHFLHCGTIWVHGSSRVVPTSEDSPRHPINTYAENKTAIEAYLLAPEQIARQATTVIHPGHIVGPGWLPLNPLGNFNPQIFHDLKSGNSISLPNLGMEMLQHVHAQDVADLFICSIDNRDSAKDQAFHAVAEQSLTLLAYTEAMIERYKSKSEIGYLSLPELAEQQSDADYQDTVEHIRHSPNCSMEKARKLLGFRPRYSAIEAINIALDSLDL